MAPAPQEQRVRPEPQARGAPALRGDAVVVSGMSGLFPESHNVQEFSDILYSKTNPVNSDVRWTLKHPQASEFTGKVPGLERFDAQFFMVHRHLGEAMDPMAKKVLEQSYQAIYDAGVNPKHLDGKKVGVYIAAALSETESNLLYDSSSKNTYNLAGSSKAMFSNRVSYWLNAKGPSITIDDACCGSVVALKEAFNGIKSGAVEAAIVGGANLCLAPQTLVHTTRCLKMSPDDKTKSFDQNAEGFTKSEAISILFLQKAKDALRVYAEVINVKCDFVPHPSETPGQKYSFVRDPDCTAKFLKTFYSEAHVLPTSVEYVEACGSATSEADKSELQAIEKVFCDNRSEPVLVGSVISNIGYTDAAAGVTAITKVLLGYHNGVLASNLHCETPRQDIPAIQDGRLCVLTDHRPFRGTYAAVNCPSLYGVNSHVLLLGNFKPKDKAKYKTSMPRLVLVSGRREEHLIDVFKYLKSQPIDAEELALFQNIHSTNVTGHLGRGYIILDTDESLKTVCLSETIENFDKARRPLWFVYSGMGSQWAGMGAQLMRIPIFAAAIHRCRKVLEPIGIDLMHIITSKDNTIFDDVRNAFVGIAAIQIGITDILTALGLRPDKIIGHSAGELGCAYADGCLTAEEMILSAEGRGRASLDVPSIRGAMAAVGLGYYELSKTCPPSIDIACRNSSTSSTISGPEEAIRDFVEILTGKGVFAKEVASANIAYHSRYIDNVGPYLLQLMSDIIKDPKPRSERWLSTSVAQESWDEPAAKYCSAQYLTNNLVSPVLFEETCRLIPRDAVLIEIAPHGLLQAILKRELPESCRNIPLTLRGHPDNTQFLLDAIGKLYLEGYHPQLQALYPKIEFPVSTGTPHLGHHAKWNHAEKWSIKNPGLIHYILASSRKMAINIHDEEHSYLAGNVIQGKMLYPFAGALVAVWDTLAMTLGYPKKEISVAFRDVHLYSQPIIHDQKQFNFHMSLHRGSGKFEFLEGDSKVATGYITMFLKSTLAPSEESNEINNVDSEEVYHHFSSRGYTYKDCFRSIASVNESLSSAQVVWNNNWVTFIDGLLQLNALRCSHEGVSQPSHIREIVIDVKQHAKMVQQNFKNDRTILTTIVDEKLDGTRCGGISLKNIKFRNITIKHPELFKLSILTPKYKAKSSEIPLATDKKSVLQIGKIGKLDSLHWEAVPTDTEDGIQISVKYAGINVSDVKKAAGFVQFDEFDKGFGMDFSGVTKSGSRVMGVVRSGAASTVVTGRPELLWPVPPTWTLEEAATVPLAYTQAFYYLFVKANLQPGWDVLIHGGAGALGQAAISIALAHGCKVFATVSDAAKKAFLLKLFPELTEDAIGNSRDDTFGDMVLHATHGNGCQIVLSCVHNDLKNISLKCVGISGITVDLVQLQNKDEFQYGMFNMTRQRSYVITDFSSVIDSVFAPTILKKLQSLVSSGISRGYVRPLTRVTFAADEAARAFRLLAASHHRGRALLRLRDSPAPATPRLVCSPSSIQLIVWDGSSFGIQFVDRLISRGARKIRIYCLRTVQQHNLKLRLWKKMGLQVELFFNKPSVSDVMSRIVDTSVIGEFIEGIYVSVTNVDEKEYNKVEKIIEDLDFISRKRHLPLKYFAVIGTGNSLGQKTSQSRSKDGLPATVLHLPDRNKVNASSGAFLEKTSWNRCALDITEIALQSNGNVLRANTQEIEKPSLLRLFPSLAGNSTHDNATLQEMGLDDHFSYIQHFLRDVFHVYFDDDNVKNLTKSKILEIERNAEERQFKEKKGLSIFFDEKNVDELLASSDWLPMDTLVYNVHMMQGAVDAERTHVFVVPGLEGLHMRFRALCERLKLPAVVLQPGLDHPREVPAELAQRYAKVLLEDFKVKTDFYILGYEFGIVIALELAAILEDHGLTGTVYCVGDDPEEMRAMLESELSSFDSEASLQEGICRHIHSLMTQDSVTSLESALRGCSSWRERVDACVRSLLGRVPHTAQYIRSLLEVVYARIGVARSVGPARELRSRLVLLRARCARGGRAPSSLQRYSRQVLAVRELAAPMAHAAADTRVPAVVNEFLHPDLLTQYENTNVCDEATSNDC